MHVLPAGVFGTRKKKTVSSLESSGGGYSHKIRERSIRMLVLSVRTAWRHLQREIGALSDLRTVLAGLSGVPQKKLRGKRVYTGQLRNKHTPFKCISVAHTETNPLSGRGCSKYII